MVRVYYKMGCPEVRETQAKTGRRLDWVGLRAKQGRRERFHGVEVGLEEREKEQIRPVPSTTSRKAI
jgi:hypothetical protein